MATSIVPHGGASSCTTRRLTFSPNFRSASLSNGKTTGYLGFWNWLSDCCFTNVFPSFFFASRSSTLLHMLLAHFWLGHYMSLHFPSPGLFLDKKLLIPMGGYAVFSSYIMLHSMWFNHFLVVARCQVTPFLHLSLLSPHHPALLRF